MDYPKVKVSVLAQGYQAKVAVYRHVTTPNEITVSITEISPIPPKPLIDSANGVEKVVWSEGKEIIFEIKNTYPYGGKSRKAKQ